jgi:hypothetical protein
MTLSAPPHPSSPYGSLVGATVLGSMLVGAGMVMGYLTVATPFVPSLVPSPPPGGAGVGLALGAWSVALIAAGGMLVAGTSRLARIVALLRGSSVRRGPAARALASMSNDVAVAAGVVLGDGPAIPELAIGAFGAVVVHTLPASNRIRRGAYGWEARTSEGWRPSGDPFDAATRDADRVRRWLGSADIDFVVRVHAALLVSDAGILRSPTCAALTVEQLPAWLASLPRQRTLTAGRRGRLLAMTQADGRRSHVRG